MSEPKITYALLQEQFKGFNLAEAHGILTALAAMDEENLLERWKKEVERINHDEAPLNQEILAILHEQLMADFDSGEFKLTLLLPEEEHFYERAAAFALWCSGYLYGFGVSQLDPNQLDEDGQEVLDLLGQFTQLDLGELEEEATLDARLELEELIEFARVGAMLLYYQYAEPRPDNEPIHIPEETIQ